MFNIFKKKEEKMTEPKAFIFIGRSGCGKGIQVEPGAFFRKFIQGEGYTQELTKQVLNTGGLMPESFVIGLWVSHLMSNFTGEENLIFDGAPRKLQEAILLDGTLNFYNIKDYKVIYVNVSRDWATKRLFARGRKDDTEEGINKRMTWFEN